MTGTFHTREDALRYARLSALNDWRACPEHLDIPPPLVFVCRGEGKCVEHTSARCDDCYVIPVNDPRGSDEVLRDMDRSSSQ